MIQQERRKARVAHENRRFWLIAALMTAFPIAAFVLTFWQWPSNQIHHTVHFWSRLPLPVICFGLAFTVLSAPFLFAERRGTDGAGPHFTARTGRMLKAVLILLLLAKVLFFLLEAFDFAGSKWDMELRTLDAALTALCWIDVVMYRRHLGRNKTLLLTFLLAASMAELIYSADMRPMFPFFLWS